MQRIALSLCAIGFVLSGCAKPAKVTTRPLPAPLLHTRSERPPRVVPAPPPRQPEITAVRPAPRPRYDTSAWIPPGGIKRDQWNVIVVHHSANPNDTPEGMDRYHRRERKWVNGLGYHFVIGNGVETEDGRVYVGSRWKRQISGAHCKSSSGRYFGTWRKSNYFNSHGIGICLIGDFEKRPPTSKQLAALRELSRFLCEGTGIDPNRMYGHADVTHKTLCPGRYLKGKLAAVRAEVHRALAASSGVPNAASGISR